MNERIQTTLQEIFGFSQLRPGQLEVIEHLLAGHSAAAIFPTGGGKSLCYQLPALLLPGVTLVVSPLIALMKDQIDALRQKGVNASRLDSSLDLEEYREVTAQLRSGQLQLLYVAPERFNNERFRESLRNVRISLFAVDEAHCISEWGHNFRPDYLKLASFAQQYGAERILALTATATPPVLEDMRRAFDISADRATRTGFYRPNLRIDTRVVDASERDGALLEALRLNSPGPAIVYVTLQKTAEAVAQTLVDAGRPARAYHAGIKADERSRIQEWFMASDDAIVVATIAFGMGVDKSNIRAVYHYNLPKSLENYSQEIGRAGRDGEPSICQMLASVDDVNTLENFIYGDTPEESALRSLIAEIFASGDEFDVSLFALSADHDIRQLVLRTLLTYLELGGYLQAGTPFYANYQFKPLKSSAEILSRFKGERRDFLAALFRQAVKGRSWFSLDPAQAAAALNTTRERIVTALDWLGEQELMEIKVAGVRHRYRRLQQPTSEEELACELHQRILAREQGELDRVRQVMDLIDLDGCQTNALARHFGEQREEPCGHCGWCLRGKSVLSARKSASINEDIWREACELQQARPETLTSPRLLARFLCGITSPRLSHGKLSGHPLFASLEKVPFGDVLLKVEQDCSAFRSSPI